MTQNNDLPDANQARQPRDEVNREHLALEAERLSDEVCQVLIEFQDCLAQVCEVLSNERLISHDRSPRS